MFGLDAVSLALLHLRGARRTPATPTTHESPEGSRR